MKIAFFTPISFKNDDKNLRQKWTEKVDHYLYLGGKKVTVFSKRSDGTYPGIMHKEHLSWKEIAIKIASYCTLVLPLLALLAKAILRSSSYKIFPITPQDELEKGIIISSETVAKIQSLLPKILTHKNDEEIEWIATNHTLVFRLKSTPSLVFKIPRPNHFYSDGRLPKCDNKTTDARFANMIQAKTVCFAHQLGLLIIPSAKKFTIHSDNGTPYTFIAEQWFDIAPHESQEEENYHVAGKHLNKAICQKVKFIKETKFNDVIWRNIPSIKDPQNPNGDRKIVLIDLEHMKSVVEGFTGSINGSCGLIGCVNEEQIDLILEEIKKAGIAIPKEQLDRAKKRRLEQLESNKKLRIFYEKKGLVTGKEPIQVDMDALGLDTSQKDKISLPIKDDSSEGCHWEEQEVTLRDAAEDIVQLINRQIQEAPENASMKGKRYFCLNTHAEKLQQYDQLWSKDTQGDNPEKEERWSKQIIQALIAKGHLFSLAQENGHGYFVQA